MDRCDEIYEEMLKGVQRVKNIHANGIGYLSQKDKSDLNDVVTTLNKTRVFLEKWCGVSLVAGDFQDQDDYENFKLIQEVKNREGLSGRDDVTEMEIGEAMGRKHKHKTRHKRSRHKRSRHKRSRRKSRRLGHKRSRHKRSRHKSRKSHTRRR